ncbi:hypothetical protein BCR34DRAFT_607323 [Clohesyomyces aquaticus]|uniref:Asl1-like glycosyl hydrolase catalytic domain-containing protein n=1 Tax=Clohesyomyces aquaticus TaxID=1231657 RepID=A0A1Y1YH46_9PLEO|nr:hypothetical protein BCR34DRAFT_607323 [Clohesyomyces aquaticus]
MHLLLRLVLTAHAAISFTVPLTNPILSKPRVLQDRNAAIPEGQGKWRGIPYNDPGLTRHFKADGSHISWAFNWDSDPYGAETFSEFVPMLWSDEADHTGKWFRNVDIAAYYGGTHKRRFLHVHRPRRRRLQEIHPPAPLQILQQQSPHQRPSVTNGPAPMGLDYLRRFLSACSDCHIDWIVIHWYGDATNAADFKKHAQDAYEAGDHRPIWITEFGAFGEEEEVIEFMKDVLAWMDHPDQRYIYRYAYQMASNGSLCNEDGNGLSPIGKVFTFQ